MKKIQPLFIMTRHVLKWITLHILYLWFTMDCIPINSGQATKSYNPEAARTYSEWKRCFGYNCAVWQQEREVLRKLECSSGGEKCQNEVNTVESDIFLTPDQVKDLVEKITDSDPKSKLPKFPKYFQPKRRKKRKISTYTKSTKQWELPIMYKCDKDLCKNKTAMSVVYAAIAHWESHTCIKFSQIATDLPLSKPHVVFRLGDTCASYIGQIPVSPQPLQISPLCTMMGSIVHEIGHLVGFYHEHQRNDRDKYVIIHGENALSEVDRKFSLELKGETNNMVPYDFGSIMHYRAWAFSKSGGQTIEPLDKMMTQALGQKSSLSYLDAKLANMAYCTGVCRTRLPQSCLHSGYQDPNRCYQCRCPDGLGGRYCESVAPSKNGDCSEIISLKEGELRYIKSPGYDQSQSYENNAECNWIVRAPPNHRLLVILDGSRFGVYCKPGVPVCYHWLEIKYLDDFSLTGPRFCCSGYPMMTIRTSGPQAVITLRANYDVSNEHSRIGFRIKVTTERDCGQSSGRVISRDETKCADNTKQSLPSNTQINDQKKDNSNYSPAKSVLQSSASQVVSAKAQAQSTHVAKTASSRKCTPVLTSHATSDQDCGMVDLTIMFDETWSSVNWLPVLQFLKDFVTPFTIAPQNVQVSFIIFGDNSRFLFNFNSRATKAWILQQISTLTPAKGSTNTGGAIKLMKQNLDRYHRDKADKVALIFLNSGSSAYKMSSIVEATKARLFDKVRIYAVGTNWADTSEMIAITGIRERVIFRNSVNDLLNENVAQNLYNSICGVDMSITLPYKGWSCSFESSSGRPMSCAMKKDVKSGVAQWGLTTSRLRADLPTAHSGKYYIAVKSSIVKSQGTSKIYIPLSTHWVGDFCLSFFTHIVSGTLQVVKQYDSSYEVVWKGSHNKHWTPVLVQVALDGCPKIGFLASVPKQPGHVAIDDIRVTKGSCKTQT